MNRAGPGGPSPTSGYDIHANRRRKKRNDTAIKPQYRLDLKGINTKALAHVAEEEFEKFLKTLQSRL